jgi:vWA-MoxR associated protein C-terminal domain/Trypsin-like peptidase domain/vWA-MoxR associated protein middle region (VMAP-M) 1
MGIHESAIAQVCTASGAVVGVAFVVTGRHLLTCAHVVNAALGAKREEIPVEQVSLVFPFLEGVPRVMARVVYWRAPRDERAIAEEDIAGLELLGEVPGINAVSFADYRLGDRQFSAFGYPAYRPGSKGVWTKGMVLESVSMGWVQIEGTSEQGRRVEQGFSGGPVFDGQFASVMGMVVAEYSRDEDAKVAYMLPESNLKACIRFLELLDRLPSGAEFATIYRQVFNQCKPMGWGQAGGSTIDEILRQLQDMPDRADGFSRLIEFVARLSGQPKLASLQGWLGDMGRSMDNKFDELVAKVLESQVQSSNAILPHLLFEVSAAEVSDLFNARILFIRNPEGLNWSDEQGYRDLKGDLFKKFPEISMDACNRLSLPELLVKAIEICQENDDVGERLRIVVSVPQVMLDEKIDQWRAEMDLGEMVPGSEFELVVCCQARNTSIYKKLQQTWRDRWGKIDASRNELAMAKLSTATSACQRPALVGRLKSEDTLGFKVSDHCLAVAQKNLLPGILASAAPIAIWLRKVPPEVECLGTLDGILNCCVEDLVPSIAGLRAAAVAGDVDVYHVGHHISLVWEDPKFAYKAYQVETQS